MKLVYIPPKKNGGNDEHFDFEHIFQNGLAQSPTSEFCKLSPLMHLGDLRAMVHHLRRLGLIIQVKMHPFLKNSRLQYCTIGFPVGFKKGVNWKPFTVFLRECGREK